MLTRRRFLAALVASQIAPPLPKPEPVWIARRVGMTPLQIRELYGLMIPGLIDDIQEQFKDCPSFTETIAALSGRQSFGPLDDACL